MIRLILLHVSLVLSVHAASLAAIQTYRDAGDFKRCVAEAQASREHFGASRLHLLWAACDAALGHHKAAMSAYERVLMLEPSNEQAQLALLQLYHLLGREMLAYELQSTLSRQQLSPKQRTSIAALHGDFAQKWRVHLGVAGGLDSNIGANSDIEITDEVSDRIIESAFYQLEAAASYAHFFAPSRTWYLRADLAFFGKQNRELNYYDIYSGDASVALGYAGEHIGWSLPLSYGRLHYMKRDLYAQYATQPSLAWHLSKVWKLQLSGLYAQRVYADAADALQDDARLGASLLLAYEGENHFAYLKPSFEQNRGINDEVARFVERDILGLNAGYVAELSLWQLRLDYHYRALDFKDTLEDESAQRQDTYHAFKASLGHRFFETFALHVSFESLQNRSNLELAEYDKQITMLQLRYDY